MQNKTLSGISKLINSAKEQAEIFKVQFMLKPNLQKRKLVIFTSLAVLVLAASLLSPSLARAQTDFGMADPASPPNMEEISADPISPTTERKIPWLCKMYGAQVEGAAILIGTHAFWGEYHAEMSGEKAAEMCTNFWTKATGWINTVMFNQFKNLLMVSLTFIATVLTHLLVFFSKTTGTIIELQDTILASGEIKEAWSFVLDIANIIFVIALLIFAVMIILRQTGYNFKKAVTSLVIAVGLANTSGLIVQALNALTNLLAKWASGIFQFTASGADGEVARSGAVNLANTAMYSVFIMFNSFLTKRFGDIQENVYSNIKSPDQASELLNYLVEATFIVFFIGFGVYVAYRLFFLFAERMVRIILYFIFAPLAFAAGLLPNKQMSDITSKWWSEMLKWLLVYPAAILLLGFSLKFIAQAVAINPKIGEMGMLSGVIALITDSAGTSGVTGALTSVVWGIIAIVILLAVANISKVTGITATAATGAAAAWGIGMFKKGTGLAWRTAAAPFKAGGKYVGARMKSMGKHAVYRVATSGPLKGITEAVTRKMAAPALLDQAREGERKKYFDTLRAQQIAKRYQSAGSARNQIAKDLFKGKEYKDLDDAEKEKFKKTNQGLKASRNLDMWKLQYMVALGEYTRSSFDKIGRTPDEVRKSFDTNMAKYGKNDKDFAAIYEAQKDMNELKIIYTKRTGPQRESAGHHYEEIRNDPKLMGLLEKSVYPFDTPPLGPAVASEVLSGAQPHVRLAIATSDVKKAREELNKINLQLGGLHRGIIEMEIRKVKPQTLEELADAQTNKKKREAFVGLGLPGTLDVLETLTKLTPKDKSEISRIQQDAELSSDEKTVSITQLLGRRGISKEEGRESIAKVLETGVAVEDLAPVSKIASTLYKDTSGLDPATAQAAEDTRKVVFGEYIPAARNYQNAQRHQTDIQYAIRTAGGDHPGYRQSYNEAIIKYGAPAVENYVSKKIPNLKSNILSSLGGLKDRTRIEENLKKAIVDVSPDIVDEKTKSLLKRAANRFKVPLGDSATLQQYIDTLEGIESVMRPIRKKPGQGTSEWGDEPGEIEEPESNEGEKS
ncbi:MAG: hypothetical protein KJ674_05940 [Nanoarchaeota archaeon]|nr:hypothetical protein [Nanoarchaeota archaeon]